MNKKIVSILILVVTIAGMGFNLNLISMGGGASGAGGAAARRSRPTSLNYSDHALVRMEERNVTKAEVEHVIKTGKRTYGKQRDIDGEHYDIDGKVRILYIEKRNQLNPLKVFLNDAEDTVITVYREVQRNPRQKPNRFESKKRGKERDLEKEARKGDKWGR